jgi:uroporphyrinogen decarboxylase
VISTENKKLLRAFGHRIETPPPVWLMRQAGRYLPEYRAVRATAGSFLELCYTPELAAEVTLQPIRRFQLDGAILFSDILVVADGLGRKVTFDDGPKLEPLRDAAEIDALDVQRVCDRAAPVFETVRRVRQELPAETALIGFAGAPWTVATYMVEGGGSRDFLHVKSWAYRSPDTFARLIDVLVDATSRYLNAQIAAGAEAVQLFDTWAGVLPEQAFRRWCLEPIREIIANVHAEHPGIATVVFARGVGTNYALLAAESGADVIGIDAATPLDWARDSVQNRCVVQGNLDPVLLVAGGAALDAEIDRIIATLGRRPFVFNLGHGVLPETPPENVARLVARVRTAR